MEIFFRSLFVYLIALTALVIVYAIHRRYSLALWAYLAAFFPEWTVYLELFGAQRLETVNLLSHTLGIFIYPIALVVLDIFLIEIALLQYLKPLRGFLPKQFQKVLKAEEVLERFQRYKAVPVPERLSRVYLAGLLAGGVHLIAFLAFGV